MKKKQTKPQASRGDTLLNLIDIPVSVRWVSISLFLFTLGRGLGGDTFFSLYVKSIIGTGIGLTLIGTLLPILKLIVVMPIGSLNDQGYSKHLLLSGKILYTLSAFFYFLAGIYHSVIFLIVAVALNGIASSTMYTTYRTLYGRNSQTHNRSQIFGIYFSSINIAYVIGALISSVLVGYLDLPYMYLFIIIFGILSILQDGKIQDFISNNFSRKRGQYSKKREKKQDLHYEVNEELSSIKQIVKKGGFLQQFVQTIFSLTSWKRTFVALKNYGQPMYIALASQALVNFINYIAFLFIPLIALEHNLSLSEIAILFAVMRLPYLINILVGNLGDKYNKKILISILVVCGAVLFFFLGSVEHFLAILGLSFGLALVVALLQPITTAFILSYAKPQDKGLIAGMQELVNRI